MSRSRPRLPALARVGVRNLLAHRVRLLLTVISVVLGTAFVAGSFVFTDTLHRAFDEIFDGVAEGVDVGVRPQTRGGAGVPHETVARIAEVPGAAVVAPQVEGPVVLVDADGAPVQSGGAPSTGMAHLPADQTVGPAVDIVDGRAPAAPGQIALNDGAVRQAGLALGDRTEVLVPSRGLQEVELVGVYRTPTDTGGFVGVLFDPDQAEELFTDGGHVQSVQIAADHGVTAQVLRDRIAQAIGDDGAFEVRTGAQIRAETQANLDEALRFVNYFLFAFGAIALVVGAFIIYNTFAMIVAQRLRELALLRAIGAGRRQVTSSVLGEALLVGAIGAVIGLGSGIGLAYGLRAVLTAADVGLPTGPLALRGRTVVLTLAVGIVVTVVSAWAPAARAGRIPPVAAMRAGLTSADGPSRLRTGAGLIVLAIAAAGLITGGVGLGRTATTAGAVGIGAAALITAVLLLGPALAGPAVRVLGAPLTRLGVLGRLARTNAVRNPHRTAATAFALTLGMMLVATVAVFGSSARASLASMVDTGVRADLIVSAEGHRGVPTSALDQVLRVDDVGDVVRLHGVRGTIDGREVSGLGATGPLAKLLDVSVSDGTAELPGDGMLVSASAAADHDWQPGTSVTVRGPDDTDVAVTVAGVYPDNPVLGDWIVGADAYADLVPPMFAVDILVLIDAVPGADPAAVQQAVTKASDPFLVVKVQTADELVGEQGRQLDQMLAVLYGLLSLAVVIAALGIVNTLALSMVERRREIGMLRALGTTRAQIRRMVYGESVLIAVYGALLGVAMGLGFGALFVHVLRDEGIEVLAVPWGQAAAMVLGAGVVGVLAALWPAARAARTDPLEAISAP